METVRRRVIVHGRVQGVFFRGSTEEVAHRLDVRGWVRNRSDGTVEAVFEGPAEAVAAAVRFCHEGPQWAHVEQVDEIDEAPEGLVGFGVRP